MYPFGLSASIAIVTWRFETLTADCSYLFVDGIFTLFSKTVGSLKTITGFENARIRIPFSLNFFMVIKAGWLSSTLTFTVLFDAEVEFCTFG